MNLFPIRQKWSIISSGIEFQKNFEKQPTKETTLMGKEVGAALEELDLEGAR